MPSTIHPSAIIETKLIGSGTRIGAFCRVLEGARIGHGVEICDLVFVDRDVGIGNSAVIGASATVLAGITIGADARVLPGAVVMRDVPPHAIVSGNPAHITGYVNAAAEAAEPMRSVDPGAPPALKVRGARLHAMPRILDLRGALSFGETGTHLPFTPQRFFMVYDVPTKEVRGEHAHKACHQFLVCVKGAISVVVDDGGEREQVLLDDPRLGLHIEPMVWGIQYQFSPDAVLLVLASHRYDAADYIRNYDEFLENLGGR
ncbi:MAG TPA: WxcM-like domain-containing protein [Burkholderiaceae bacterium]